MNHTTNGVLSRSLDNWFRIVAAKPIKVKLPFRFSGTSAIRNVTERRGRRTARGNCCGHVTKFVRRWDFQRRQLCTPQEWTGRVPARSLTIREPVRFSRRKDIFKRVLKFPPCDFRFARTHGLSPYRNPLGNYSGWKSETRSTISDVDSNPFSNIFQRLLVSSFIILWIEPSGPSIRTLSKLFQR